jgi:hypothetical protein
VHASPKTIETYFGRAVAEFRRNPVARKLLRQMAEEVPNQFFTHTLNHLEKPEESHANRLLTVLLMRQPSLFEFIADPSMATRDRASRLVRRIMKYDASFDVKVARRLPDRSGMNHREAFKGLRAARILDVLDEVSEGRRLLPVLYHLVDSCDPKLSEKATLFVGRRVRTPEWAARQLLRPDPRARANAVESIWGVDEPEAVALLQHCVNDSHNRVAGNALMGLYILERPGVDAVIPSMAVHPKAEFRSTAAWMMGRVARAEFIPDLKKLLQDESPMVRSTALRALVEIRKADEKIAEPLAQVTSAMPLDVEQLVPAHQLTPDEILAEEMAAPLEDALAEDAAVPVAFELKLDGSSFSFSA